MELLEGRGLDERIGREPLDVDTAIELAIQIADALDAAHTPRASCTATSSRPTSS